MKKTEHTTNRPVASGASVKMYVTGFILSIVLTLIPYFIVVNHALNGVVLLTVLVIIALGQLVVQLYYFLHMKEEAKPRMNLLFFLSFFSIILIIMFASIWIMQDLNYQMGMEQMQEVMQHGEGF
jgi:cytochrome o ubiquinol oxidase subunit IV